MTLTGTLIGKPATSDPSAERDASDTSVDSATIDEDKLSAFLGQVVGELGATINAGLIVIGDRLGLYRAMAGAGPIGAASWPSVRHDRALVREC